MLRWTCRLRDALEQRGLWAPPWVLLPNMWEAEFDYENGAFPDGFRWDALRGCLSDEEDNCVTLYIDPGHRNGLVPAFDGHDPEAISDGRRFCGTRVTDLDRQDIDVLWLSPSVFISAADFELPGTDGEPIHVADYSVRLTRANERDIVYHAYSLSYFEGNGFTAPSPLPMKLLSHVAENLPVGYFKMIDLESGYARADERLPVECLLQFVAIVPHAPMSPSKQKDTIKLKIGTKMNREDLQEIYSHRFHPRVELSFSSRDSFDESVPLSVFLDLSRECQHLRTVNLPHHFLVTEDMHLEQTRIVVDATFKSPRMTLQSFGNEDWFWTTFSHLTLHKIAAGLGSNEMQIGIMYPWRQRDFLHLCIHPFLQEDATLERLCVGLLTCVNKNSSNTITNCRSKTLLFFDVSVVYGEGKQKSAHLESWDNVLFPRLSLNYSRKHMTQRLCGGTIPLAIKAVNAGIVYSKTTGQAPFDMSTANAGLIFRFLKSEVDTLHACPRPSSLSGKKRPALS
jgi:hypothetical protein